MVVRFETFCRGAFDLGTYTPPANLPFGLGALVRLNPDADGKLILPDARFLPTGVDLWWLSNVSLFDVDLVDMADGPVATIEGNSGSPATPMGVISLADNASARGDWIVDLRERRF